ncbi:MAG: hypothetical protein WCR31_08290 [Treponema sp.]
MDLFELSEIKVKSMTEEEAKETLNHIRKQFQEQYKYILGKWSDSKRARSTVSGKFVSMDDILEWINIK